MEENTAVSKFFSHLEQTRRDGADPAGAGADSMVFNDSQVWTAMWFFRGKLQNLSLAGDGPHPIVVMAEIGRAMIGFATTVMQRQKLRISHLSATELLMIMNYQKLSSAMLIAGIVFSQVMIVTIRIV